VAYAIETGGGRLEQGGGVVLDAAVRGRDGLVRRLVKMAVERLAAVVIQARARRRRPDIERNDHRGL
jgi:hypothetical protein